MGRTATSLLFPDSYTRQTTTGKISSAYNIPLQISGSYTPLSFGLDFPSTAKVGDGSAGTIEFWVYLPTGAVNNPHALVNRSGFVGSGNGDLGSTDTYLQTGGQLRWRYGTSNWGPNLVDPTGNTWYHVVLQTPGNANWYFWLDGVYKGTATESVNLAFPTIYFGKSGLAGNQYGGLRFDEIRISSIERYTAGSDFTAPTSAFSNDDNTLALFHCDSASETDDTAAQLNGTAALTSTATLTANSLVVDATEYVHTGYWAGDYTVENPNRFGSAALTSAFTQTVTGGIVKLGSSSLSSTATIAATARLRKDGASALSSSASMTVVGGLRKDGASALSSTATVSVSAEVSKTASAALISTATQSVSAVRTFKATSALAATASLSSSSRIAKFASASLTSTATMTTNGGLRVVGASALSTTATQSVSGARAKVGSASLSTAATQTAIGSRRFNAVSGLNATATLTASGQDFDIASANLTSAFTLTADGDTLFSVSASLSSAFTMTTVAEMLQQVNVERTIAVKSETRIIKALQDQRIIPVNSESRINIVLSDTRTILVPDETRILKEP
jgi:hypothetical protein